MNMKRSKSSWKLIIERCKWRFIIFRRETYKHYSAVAPSGLVPSIGTNVLGDIVANCPNLIDYKTLKLSDIDLEFISTKSIGKTKYNFMPERQLVRYQFLELLTRISLTKYFSSKICSDKNESIKKCYESHFLSFMKTMDSRTWRLTHLWTEEWDTIFKRYHSTLFKIFSKYIGKYALPGAPHYMSIHEFIELVGQANVVNDDFGQREIGSIFNLAMMTRVDELAQEKHMNMSYVEFLEAIGRISQRLKLPSLIDEDTGNIKDYESIIKTVITFCDIYRKHQHEKQVYPLWVIICQQ